MSIVNKLLFIYLINISLFIGYIAYNYTFTTTTLLDIKSTKNTILPIATLQNKNLYLLETLMTTLSDAIILNEKDMLNSVQDISDKIMINFKDIELLNTNQNIKSYDLQIQKEQYIKYFSISFNLAIKLIDNKIVQPKEYKEVNNSTKKILRLFKQTTQITSVNLTNKLDKLSSQTNTFFDKSLYLALLALVFITLFSLYLYKMIQKRFQSALESLKSDGKLDKITTVSDKYDDEITKFQTYYDKLFLEKTKAQTLAKIKTEFLSHMSHEIRTPMNGIMSISYMLEKTPLNETQKKYINTMKNSSESLLHIVNDILDIGKIEAGKMELNITNFNLIELLDDVNNTVKYKATEKGLKYEVVFSKDMPKIIQADKLRISQILINIISNGIKFTDIGYIKVNIEIINNLLKFTIKDSGIGIPKKIQSKLFLPYTQATKETSSNYGGSGLGLSIVKKLLDMMGGDIEIKSDLSIEIGTSFIIQIPIEIQNLDSTTKPISTKDEINILFTDLKKATLTNRTKNCKIILNKINNFHLNADNKEKFNIVSTMIENRKFSDANGYL